MRHRIGFSGSAACGLVAVGCGQVLGVDEYRAAEPPAGDAGEVALPLLPGQPDVERRPDCTRCVRDSCGSLRATCLRHQRCHDMLACQGLCDNPNCITQCTDRLPRSVDFEDYFACAFQSVQVPFYPAQPSLCLEPCGAGKNWGCRGRYAWDARSPEATTVHAQVYEVGSGGRGPLATLPGITIAPCTEFTFGQITGDAGCAAGVAVDAYGARDVPLTPFQEIFVLQGGAGERNRIYPRPIARSGPLSLWAFSVASPLDYLPIALSSMPAVDRNLGMINFATLDCLLEGAVARTELASPGTARRFYSDHNPDPTAETGFTGVFYDVQPSATVRIQAFVDGINTAVATRTVLVAPGWLTTVTHYPADSQSTPASP